MMQHAEKRRARSLHKNGLPLSEIVVCLGNKYTEQEIEAGIEALRQQERDARERQFTPWRDVVPFTPMAHVPAHVIADRDRRSQARENASLTARQFGDPPPGFSALERSPSITPEKQPDPLAVLMFRGGNVRARRSKSLGKYG